MARLKVIGVTSGSGGAGKTFVATNLAVGILQQVRGGVLFLDASGPCPGDGCAKMGLPRNKSVSDLLPLLDRLTPEFLTSYLMSAPSGVPCLSLVNDVVQANALNRGVLEQVFKVLDQAFDYLVMDLSWLTGDIGAFLIDRTDQVCIVVDPMPQGVARAGHLLGLLRGAQVPLTALALCVNRTTEAYTGSPAGHLGPPVLMYLADKPEVVTWAETKGRTLIEMRPDDDLSAGFADLSRAFIQRAFRHRAEAAREGHATVPSDVRRDLKLRILRRLIEEIDLRKGDLGYLHDPVKRQEMHVRVEGKLVALVQEEAVEAGRQDRRQLVKELMDEALGLGPLEDLLEDPAVTEIMVNRIDQVYVERKGQLTLSNVSFLSNDQLRGIIERIVAPLGRRIDEKVPMVDARLRDGGIAALLSGLDAATAARLDRQNPARVQRAWEVLRATGRGLADWQADTPAPLLPLARAEAWVLTPRPDWLAERINRRFAQMLDQGALDEVRAALPHWPLDSGAPTAPLWTRAIGAPDLIAHLRGQISLSEAIEAATLATRQYAKRQRSWFRGRMQGWRAHPLP